MSHARFDELRERLLRAGIAPRHVRRYIAELSDHFDDLVREEAAGGLQRDAAEDAARTRIGSDEALAAVMLARPELRSLSARFPLAVFGFAPLLALAAIVVAAIFIEVGFLTSHLYFVLRGGGPRPTAPPQWIKTSIDAWNWLVVYAAPLAVAAMVSVLGARQRMRLLWIALGAILVCVVGGFLEVGVRWAETPGTRSELYVSWEGPYTRAMVIASMRHAAVNLAVVCAAFGLWLGARKKRHFNQRAPN